MTKHKETHKDQKEVQAQPEVNQEQKIQGKEKQVQDHQSAIPMTREEHNKHTGRDLHVTNLDDEGYLVKDKDGERWLTKEEFENSEHPRQEKNDTVQPKPAN